ncbi:hypothetical protein DYE50_02970 [Treponema ruminis]|nr:hypothetical protein DYE50_02970 [Treponema ruminis]
MKKNMSTFLLCMAAIALNFLFAYVFCDVLHIPLFMDTVFTVAITFYCGLLPGLVAAIGYNIISVLTFEIRGYAFDPFAILFAVCGILITLVTWLFARRKEEFRISPVITILYLVLIAMLSSFASIISSGVVDYVRFSLVDLPDRIAPIKNFTDSFVNQHFSLFAACILAQIPVSIMDRLITTFLGFGVYKLMVRFLGKERW